ncbi:fused MFS/spermidine synthase [Nocardioides koreensis]|uniref:Fused MFS/spermidine synthase n=1 Tax=Nocardioides koreensis TaxID=433651 RepID=A0ABP5LMW0_9ACTN
MEIVPTERPNAYVLRVDGADQSHVDLDDPTRLEFDYVRRMGDVLDARMPGGEPLRIVHVGGAAMTLPRYVATTRPRSSQIVLEPAAELTELVRSELPLPRRSGIKVRPVHGRAGAAELREDSADVVILDAFDGARVPADLVTTEYFTSVSRALTDSGWFLLNLTDRAPFAWTRRVIAGLRTVFAELMVSAEPATLRGRRFGNLLVVTSRASVPVTSLRQRAASSAAPYRVLDAGQVSSSLGGGMPFTDDDTRPSPLPQDR